MFVKEKLECLRDKKSFGIIAIGLQEGIIAKHTTCVSLCHIHFQYCSSSNLVQVESPTLLILTVLETQPIPF